MIRKLKLPILLVAVVIMLSIFYIKDAQDKKKGNSTPVDSGSLNTSVLNPEFTEARIERLEAVNLQIAELEELIAGGTLTADGVLETTAQIDDLKEVKRLETDLEEVIMDQMEYDDVLVILEESEVIVDVYTDEDIDILTKIEILKLASNSFTDKAQEYSVVVSNSME